MSSKGDGFKLGAIVLFCIWLWAYLTGQDLIALVIDIFTTVLQFFLFL